MPNKQKLKVVLCWHMHQPEYRDQRNGEYFLPWTYLHVIKDYVDMAAHLEAVPDARAVVNFVPTLLEQVDDYAGQVQHFLNNTGTIRDPLLAALAEPVLVAATDQRLHLIKDCLRANRKHMIDRFPAYRELVTIADWLVKHPDALIYTSEQFFVDLIMWYHLAWMGETVRRSDLRVKRLLEQQTAYTLHDRHELLGIIGELLSSLIGRYRALAERGQVELSVTPYAHPIMPLLLDIESAREAMPDVTLPTLQHYPGGAARVRWHLTRGLEVFRHYFGSTPRGCWPSEGSLSETTLKLLSETGFEWTATGESVLRNSLDRPADTGDLCGEESVHHAYRLRGTQTGIFFRDDGLSDLIGFTYADWKADDAVANLVHHLGNIADACRGKPDSVASIILDGENAWEYYPQNGYYFLRALYEALVDHPDLELTTFSACLDAGITPTELPHLVAGSWVYGTFSTWIGDTDKNAGWNMLGDAKQAFDRAVASGKLEPDRLALAEQQLAICEGSDWFWWFGDYNPAESVECFEYLYRSHLSNLYHLLGEEPPSYLSRVFSHGAGSPAMGGTMRPGQSPG
jgi:alpha-amylase/alpha-mannosidase (GH57 family)